MMLDHCNAIVADCVSHLIVLIVVIEYFAVCQTLSHGNHMLLHFVVKKAKATHEWGSEEGIQLKCLRTHW